MPGLYLLTLAFSGEAPIDTDPRRVEGCFRATALHFKIGRAVDFQRRESCYRRIFGPARPITFHRLVVMTSDDEARRLERAVLTAVDRHRIRHRRQPGGRIERRLEWLDGTDITAHAVAQCVQSLLPSFPGAQPLDGLPALGVPSKDAGDSPASLRF